MLTLKSLSSTTSTHFYTYKILNYAYKIATMYPKRASTNCPIPISEYVTLKQKTIIHCTFRSNFAHPYVAYIRKKKIRKKKEETSDTQINGIHPQTLTFLKRFRNPIIVFYYSYITIYFFFSLSIFCMNWTCASGIFLGV